MAGAGAGGRSSRWPTATTSYAAEVAAPLEAAGLRAEVDARTESMGRKIRDAEVKSPLHARGGRPRGERPATWRCVPMGGATWVPWGSLRRWK